MNIDPSKINFTVTTPQNLSQHRLDVALSSLLPEYSRAQIQKWIMAGHVTVDNKNLKPKDKIIEGQIIKVAVILEDTSHFKPKPIKFDIIYVDQDIIVVNKPAGLVTHPGAGNIDNTLLNALLYQYPELAKLPRAGIIHRLDKDTSGVMVVARNLASHNSLTQALAKREIKREYEAIVNGKMIAGGTIEAPIGRHPVKRTHMAVKSGGKTAITHYRVIERFQYHTHIRVFLETGRTHQIRVHMAHIGYPIVGDPTYCKINKISEKLEPILRQKLSLFKRQALHAHSLEFFHPRTNKLMKFDALPPEDFLELLEILKSS